jgi:hypothetical protein
VLDKNLMQGQIAACSAAAGADKVAGCLTANGLLDATTGLAGNSLVTKPVLQASIDTCATNVGAANIARCLVVTALVLSPNPVQDQFNTCNRFADPTGIAACLTASGMLPATTTQANVDTCLTAAGLAGIETCMRTRGFIQ